jgi:dihydrofolate reductase
MQGGTTFTFVTDGIESALEQAREAAGGRDVSIGGGADVAQQYLAAGLVDDLRLHLAPVFLGPGGVRLFDNLSPGRPQLELTGAVESPAVTHLTYRIVKEVDAHNKLGT